MAGKLQIHTPQQILSREGTSQTEAQSSRRSDRGRPSQGFKKLCDIFLTILLSLRFLEWMYRAIRWFPAFFSLNSRVRVAGPEPALLGAESAYTDAMARVSFQIETRNKSTFDSLSCHRVGGAVLKRNKTLQYLRGVNRCKTSPKN